MAENKALIHPLHYYIDLLQGNNTTIIENASPNILRVMSLLRNNEADAENYTKLSENNALIHPLRYYLNLLREKNGELIGDVLSNILRVMSLSRVVLYE